MPEVAESVADVEPKDKRTNEWKAWKRRQDAATTPPPAVAPTATTIEELAGIPLGDSPTTITPDMTAEDVDMLVQKAKRFHENRRVAVTRFENGARSVEVVQTRPVPAAAQVAVLPVVEFGIRGTPMDFVEFCNRRFVAIDKAATDAVMASSTPHPALSTTRKLYAAYLFCVRNAASAEAAAQAGLMD